MNVGLHGTGKSCVCSHRKKLIFILQLCRESLLTRTRALQKKQRSGNVALPTPGRQSPSLSRLSVVPDFTPVTRRRPHPPSLRPKLPPAFIGSSSENHPSDRPKVHGSLLAPRYSHLLEEAIAIGQDQSQTEPEPDVSVEFVNAEVSAAMIQPVLSAGETPLDSSLVSDESAVNIEQDRSPVASSPGISKRVKGFFFSYLPTLSKTMPHQKSEKLRSSQPGLPLPPPEVLGKARGPISTPVRPPAPRPIPPKEQVHLQHAPSPKKSTLPRPSKPQRLIALNPTPVPLPAEVPIQRNRRSSGGSVKDLVRSFEVRDSDVVKMPEIKRVRSNGAWDKECRKGNKPAWRL